jgi:hypothetical protein
MASGVIFRVTNEVDFGRFQASQPRAGALRKSVTTKRAVPIKKAGQRKRSNKPRQ